MEFNISAICGALNSEKPKHLKIAVTGDFCLDKYLYIDGRLDEKSLETSKTAYQVVKKAMYPGAAGTIANNLASLGVKVVCVGLLGEDGEGWELENCLRSINADTSYMIRSRDICTSTYTKPMYDDGGAAPYELNRLDFKNFRNTPGYLEEKLKENIAAAYAQCDAMIICDQFVERNHAAITDSVRHFISTLWKDGDKLLFADSRGFIHEFRNVMVKCNNIEAAKAFGYDEMQAQQDEIIIGCGNSLAARNGRPVMITEGIKGSRIFENGVCTHINAFKVEGPIDICGAGDSVNAGFAFAVCSGLSLPEAALVANAVASITIQQIGVTGVATVEQVCQRLKSYRQ